MKLYDVLLRGAAISPDKPAIKHGQDSLSYSQLVAASGKLGAWLNKQSLSPDARVALLWENSLPYAIALFGVSCAGLTVVPVDTSLGSTALKQILDDCRPEVLIVQPKYARKLAGVLDRQSSVRAVISESSLPTPPNGATAVTLAEASDDFAPPALPNPASLPKNGSMKFSDWPGSPHELAALFYTSGSTGRPKGVMLSHRNLVSNTIGTVEYLGLTRDDSVLVVLPFYYIYGNSLLLTHLLVGGTLVIENRFAYPQLVIKALETSGVTGFAGVPSTFIMLLNLDRFEPGRMPHLRYVTQAGGAMAPEVTRRLVERLGSRRIFIMYGQTEAAPRITWLPPELLEDHIGSVGKAVPGVQIDLIGDDGKPVSDGEAGEIVVGGPGVMMGYWNNQDEPVLRDGRLYTGDLARRNDAGLYTIVARKKEIIKAGGYRVSAKEVEETLLGHEAVLETAVIGVEDNVLGEAIKAVVVLKPGSEADKTALRNHVKARLAWHKVPKVIEFRDSLPKYKTGKVNKLALSEAERG